MTAFKNSLGLRAGLLSLVIFVAIVGIWQIATLPTAATGPAMDPEYAKLVGAAAASDFGLDPKLAPPIMKEMIK